jgi:hypothetical protein
MSLSGEFAPSFGILLTVFFHSFDLQKRIKTGKTSLSSYSHLFDILFDSIELINSSFTFHLIFVMINILSLNIFATYGVVREFLSRSEMFSHQIINNVFWILTHCFLKSLMAFLGSSTTKEAMRPRLIILKALEASDSTHRLQDELKNLLEKLKNRNPNIENEFFVINWKLILSVSLFFGNLNVNLVTH